MDNKKDLKDGNIQEKELNKKKYTKSFYAVFALCLCAIGAAAWFTYGDVSDYTQPQSEEELTTTIEENKAANAKVEGITKGSVEFTTVATQPKTAPYTQPKTQSVDAQLLTEPTIEQSRLLPAVEGEVTKAWSADKPVYYEVLKDWRLHKATDFKAKQGDSVKAIDNGIVTEIKTDDLYGATIVIEHNSGFVVNYSGVQAKEALSVGDHVSSGDKIGKVTKVPCESKDTSHIHLEVTKDGESINPIDILS